MHVIDGFLYFFSVHPFLGAANTLSCFMFVAESYRCLIRRRPLGAALVLSLFCSGVSALQHVGWREAAEWVDLSTGHTVTYIFALITWTLLSEALANSAIHDGGRRGVA